MIERLTTPADGYRVPGWLATTAAYGWRLLVVAAVTALLAAIVTRLQVIVIPLLLALFIAAVLGPPAAWLRKRGIPSLAATWLVILLATAVVAGMAWMLVPRLVGAFGDVGMAAGESYAEVRTWLIEGPIGLDPATVDDVESTVAERARNFVQNGLPARAGLVLEIITAAFLTLVVAFFYIKDGHAFRDKVVGVLKDRDQERARDSLATGWSVLQRYLAGVLVVGLADAILIGIGLAIIGVPLVFSLAALTFFAAFFPLVGAIFAGGMATLLALASGGPTDALLVLGLTVLVQQLDGDIIAPMVYSRAVNLHPLGILLALTAGGLLAGLIGAFLAVPVLAVSTAMIKEWRERAPEPEETAEGTAPEAAVEVTLDSSPGPVTARAEVVGSVTEDG